MFQALSLFYLIFAMLMVWIARLHADLADKLERKKTFQFACFIAPLTVSSTFAIFILFR